MLVIYKVTNKINGKIYVGKDSRNKPSYLGSGIIINKAIKKYGRENFVKEILEECTRLNINERERYWIVKLNSRDRNVGYNISIGGGSTCFGSEHPCFGKKLSAARSGVNSAWYGKKHSEETKRKMSESNKGKNLGKSHSCSEECKKRLSEMRKGVNNPMYGKKHTKEWLKNTSDFNKGKVLSEEHKKKIGDGNRGKIISEEARRKQSEAIRGEKHPFFGKHRSEETKRKIGDGNRGKIVSEETRRKLSASCRDLRGDKNPMHGKKHSAETRRKMVLSWERRRQAKKLLKIAEAA